MNTLGIIFSIVDSILLFVLPRRQAPLALLMGATYMATNRGIVDEVSFLTAVRLLIIVGLLRVLSKRERINGGLKSLDWMMLWWAIWAVVSSIFHKDPSATVITRLGMDFDGLGVYFLMRAFIQDFEDFLWVAKASMLLLIPVAAGMLVEKYTRQNFYGMVDGVAEYSSVRHGKIRAQGPFSHEILAGSVAAITMPLVVLFWAKNRKAAIAGFVATGLMLFACASSGPILTVATAFGSLALWRFRNYMSFIRWSIMLLIIGLDLVMNDPVWYLMARVDLAGGSTGWYRAALIDAAINHFNEWWLGGTDYTRNWMVTGTYWSKDQADITNHYIQMGVYGGLLLMLLFISILIVAFNYISQMLRYIEITDNEELYQRRYLIWLMGSILFAHAVAFISICYYDYTIVFFYFLLAAIASIHTKVFAEVGTDVQVAPDEISVEAATPSRYG